MVRGRFYKGFLETIKWKSTYNLSCCVKDSQNSLFLASRRLVYPQLKISHLYTSIPQIKQQQTSVQCGFTKLFQFPSFKISSTQFHHCFYSRNASNEPQENNSVDLKPDAYSQLTKSASKLSHVDSKGHAKMVDVGAKEDTSRVAVATAMVYLGQEAFHLVKENKVHKGDVLTVAQLAGIMASKLTPSLIPLCHNIHVTHSEVNLELDDENFAVCITGTVNCVGKTGVEMESLTAVTVAALTVYDMCKAVSRDIVISDVKLVRKSGGKSGDYVAP